MRRTWEHGWQTHAVSPLVFQPLPPGGQPGSTVGAFPSPVWVKLECANERNYLFGFVRRLNCQKRETQNLVQLVDAAPSAYAHAQVLGQRSHFLLKTLHSQQFWKGKTQDAGSWWLLQHGNTMWHGKFLSIAFALALSVIFELTLHSSSQCGEVKIKRKRGGEEREHFFLIYSPCQLPALFLSWAHLALAFKS